jgi:hypothetical protein
MNKSNERLTRYLQKQVRLLMRYLDGPYQFSISPVRTGILKRYNRPDGGRQPSDNGDLQN